MDFGLTPEQKRNILLTSKETTMSELYLMLVRAGVDPDQFDPTQGLQVDDTAMGERIRIEKLTETINLIDSKLAALEV